MKNIVEAVRENDKKLFLKGVAVGVVTTSLFTMLIATILVVAS